MKMNRLILLKGVRIGFVLEELDAMAGKVAYAHALGNTSLVSDVRNTSSFLSKIFCSSLCLYSCLKSVEIQIMHKNF
jgi:hypothetical protein